MRSVVSFVRFVVVGAIAALVNVAARIVLEWYVPFELAVALAFPIALTVAFVGNRRWVFPGATDWRRAYWRFFVVNLAALAQVWLISVGLYRLIFPMIGFTWHAELVAHVIGVLSPVVTSYYAHKHYSFRAQPAEGGNRPGP
jgi:putative flippase GtrA